MTQPEPSPEPRDATAPTAIFRREGALWLPSEYAQGPWHPGHQHGGPVCGLLARAVEACAGPGPMRVARLTVEMTRAVPMRPLALAAETSRAGRRVQQIDARLECEGRVVARASALRIRVREPDAAMAIPLDEPVPPRVPGPVSEPAFARHFFPGFLKSIDFVRTRTPERGGEGLTWARMRTPLVDGEETSPLVRLATLCDFASGTGNPLDFGRYTSINPDLSLHVLRLPRGEWIGLRARTRIEADGVGHSHATLFDDDGPVARALVSLLIEPRPEPLRR